MFCCVSKSNQPSKLLKTATEITIVSHLNLSPQIQLLLNPTGKWQQKSKNLPNAQESPKIDSQLSKQLQNTKKQLKEVLAKKQTIAKQHQKHIKLQSDVKNQIIKKKAQLQILQYLQIKEDIQFQKLKQKLSLS